jgi:8-oxo-dGTP pyrophosphatase MutT (NUDIX family)
MKKEKSCGAIIFRKHQKNLEFVIIKQKHGFFFGFPKGHVEPDENEVETARREVMEEVGLDVNIFEDIRGTINYEPKPGVSKEVVYFLAEAKNKNITKQTSEIDLAFWVKEDKVLKTLTYDSDKKLFKNFLSKAFKHK